MISYYCIVFSLFIPLASAGFAKLSSKGYDNSSPREFLEKTQGRAKRAHHAQNNFYETFPAFAVGVVAAHQLNANPQTVDLLAMTYVAMRIVYLLFYIFDRHVLRTISWMIAFLSIISLYICGF